ncbi:hypothetical protein ACFXTN_025898 [Malus domestica]
MATTTVATTVTTTRDEVHGIATTARAVPSKAYDTKATTQAMSLQAQRELNALPSRAQASHPCALHSKQPALAEQPTLMAQPAPPEQPTLVAQPAPSEQSILVTQPVSVAQPAPTEQLTLVAQSASAAQSAHVAFQVAQIVPRLVQLSQLQIFRLTI